ncbi:hypothetical protein MG296_10730 [Flavobacteriaceae bacterium TK19130]|nr:hypothetical protein [Thermobacterium salinum]
MIQKKQTKVFRRFLGSDPVSQIQSHLEEKGIKNRSDEFYSREFVSRVFNGNASHSKIEAAIWEFIEEETERRKEVVAKRTEVLETAKTLSHA